MSRNPGMNQLVARFTAVTAEVNEIQEILKDNPNLTRRAKDYLLERCFELGDEMLSITRAKLDRGDPLRSLPVMTNGS